MLKKTFKKLYAKYLSENPVEPVSYGRLFALKPFYLRYTTQKDIEMCLIDMIPGAKEIGRKASEASNMQA